MADQCFEVIRGKITSKQYSDFRKKYLVQTNHNELQFQLANKEDRLSKAHRASDNFSLSRQSKRFSFVLFFFRGEKSVLVEGKSRAQVAISGC